MQAIVKRVRSFQWLGLLLIGAAMTVVPSTSHASDDPLMVILHPRNPTRAMSAGLLKKIYLGEQAYWAGTVPIKAYNRRQKSTAENELLGVLGISSGRFEKHWTAKQLAGQGVAPAVLNSPQDVVAKVQQSPISIGYVLKSELDALNLGNLIVLEVK